MLEVHQFTEEDLIESMHRLAYSMQKLEILLKEKKPVGYYESAIEKERKWNTGRNRKHISY